MTNQEKLELKYAKLIGEFKGTITAIIDHGVPTELFNKLDNKRKELDIEIDGMFDKQFNQLETDHKQNKTISARFIGKDGSCGYKYHEMYVLEIQEKQTLICIKRPITLIVNKGYCEYESVVAFLNNWDSINIIK